jgi:diaminopimelate epimerase
MKYSFSKYAGSGNDFIFIDNRNAGCPVFDRQLISRLCTRRTGIGADGIILLENSQKADFKMVIFNSDGSEAEMCGNGIRCLLKFIQELGFSQKSHLIETKHSKIKLSDEDGMPCVYLSCLSEIQSNIYLTVDGQNVLLHFMNTGVPHAVLFVEDLNCEDWMKLAPKIRKHPFFSPHGTNVNFVSLTDEKKTLHMRTYERGVEGETLACGTGATAAALIAAQIYNLVSPIRVIPLSKEFLEISFQSNHLKFYDVALKGPANFIFRGEVVLD